VTLAVSGGAELARARALADRAGLQWLDLDGEQIDPRAADLLPLPLALSALAVPVRFDGTSLVVAVGDPSVHDEIVASVGVPVRVVVAPRVSVANVLGSLQQARRRGSVLRLPGIAAPEMEMEALRRAAAAGATDLHLVPGEDGLALRVRIDGALRTIGALTADQGPTAVSRIKVQAGLDISESRRSQEGRLRLELAEDRVFDVRVTTVPTVAGEGATLRLLERTRRAPTLTEIGLLPELQLALERLVNQRRGALLVTGPTGSGKSTTIHAALAGIAHPDLNLVTVEDPVEYRVEGAYQIEVNPHTSVTFESALRSILRSDPDVVAVGEMRDRETAAATLKAALAGSFVLSSLHTDDAPSAITRLRDMGVEPYVTAATVRGVLAQRLVRRLCVYCRERRELAPDEAAELGLEPGEPAHLFQAGGCDHCDRGYLGLVAVHQLLLVDDELRRLTLAGAPQTALVEAAFAAGMRTLWEDGLAKALAGLTTVDELHGALPGEG